MPIAKRQMPYLIDTHCHLHLPAYDGDRDVVISRMQERRIAAITVGTNGRSSEDAIALAEREEGIWAAVGYHPSHLTGGEDEYEKPDTEPFSIERLKTLATSSSRVVAIGEAGIDETYLKDSDPDRARRAADQRAMFRDHVRIALELDLPLIIHTRGAFREIAEILSDESTKGRRCRAVVHCFTGSWDEASILLDLGLMISFTGIITFKPRKTDDPKNSVLRAVERIPADRIMVETDAPWLSPEPHRGVRNEPAFVEHTARKIAQIRGVELEDFARQTTENAVSFFRLRA
jgi:TatD DNase family protein